jgi:hypothetical protein
MAETASSCKEVFDNMASRFKKDAAKGLNAT